ncbi:hypothetical protein MPER_07501 [Moniliophthora perniciosa FA553]|nr:hypothetical protein MPER_07501 [Moniliophthora perniciosa FA553]
MSTPLVAEGANVHEEKGEPQKMEKKEDSLVEEVSAEQKVDMQADKPAEKKKGKTLTRREKLEHNVREMARLKKETERVNETLSLSVMIKGQPYKELPDQYRPIDDFCHHPPLFIYGWAMPLVQSIDIVHRTGTIADIINKDPKDLEPSERDAYPYIYVTRLNIELRLKGKGIWFDFPIANPNGGDDHIGVVTIQTNYHFDVPLERFDEVVKRLNGVFGSEPGPMWYVATNDFTVENYPISFSNIKRYYGAVESYH